MNWRDGFETPQNFSEMLRIEARWVRQNYSSLTARYLEQAADAIDELAAEPKKSASNPVNVAKFQASSFVMVNDVAVLEGER